MRFWRERGGGGGTWSGSLSTPHACGDSIANAGNDTRAIQS